MKQVVEKTGLSEGKIRHLVSLGLIELPSGNGRGIKRFSDEDIKLLSKASELLKLGSKRPSEVVDFLLDKKRLLKLIELSDIFQLDPSSPHISWLDFITTLLNFDEFTSAEQILLRSIIDDADSVLNSNIYLEPSVNFSIEDSVGIEETRYLIDRMYMKIGKLIVLSIKLSCLESEIINSSEKFPLKGS